MKKFALIVMAMFLFVLNVQAAKHVKSDFLSVIKDSGVDTESIAVSIKSAEGGKAVYSLNNKMLMNPASVQKVITTPAMVEALGEDYMFSTEIYSRGEDAFLIKLGADPYLTSTDLRKLANYIKLDTKKVYIDDSVLDNKTWGEGWQWDDDMNPLMPRFGSYNLDKNLIKLTIMPPEGNAPAVIINPSRYPLVFFNNIKAGDKTDVQVYRDNAVSANTIMLSGTVARPTTVFIPANNLKRYFDVQLTRTLENKKVYLKDAFVSDKQTSADKYLDKVTHDMDSAVIDIFKNSNNMVTETLFKLAGKKYCNLETGTDASGIKMFNDYCLRNKLDNSRIRITDASGVSKNNLVSADFVTDVLYVNKDNKIMEKLPAPGEGTLTHRMLTIKDNLRAKTGTLSDISSIAGYLTSKSGKKYVFCIMINDMKLSSADKKMLEDFLIREAYLRL